MAKYKTFGKNAFIIQSANLNYSAAFKKQVVEAYLHGEGSYKDVSIKYIIQAASAVLQWVKRYNNHEELTDSRPEGVYRMVKNNLARKTTLEDRLSIVEHCIEGLYDRRGHEKAEAEEELVKAIHEYIDYYTNRRVQRKLDFLTPMEYHERLKSAA